MEDDEDVDVGGSDEEEKQAEWIYNIKKKETG